MNLHPGDLLRARCVSHKWKYASQIVVASVARGFMHTSDLEGVRAPFAIFKCRQCPTRESRVEAGVICALGGTLVRWSTLCGARSMDSECFASLLGDILVRVASSSGAQLLTTTLLEAEHIYFGTQRTSGLSRLWWKDVIEPVFKAVLRTRKLEVVQAAITFLRSTPAIDAAESQWNVVTYLLGHEMCEPILRALTPEESMMFRRAIVESDFGGTLERVARFPASKIAAVIDAGIISVADRNDRNESLITMLVSSGNQEMTGSLRALLARGANPVDTYHKECGRGAITRAIRRRKFSAAAVLLSSLTDGALDTYIHEGASSNNDGSAKLKMQLVHSWRSDCAKHLEEAPFLMPLLDNILNHLSHSSRNMSEPNT